ncbi:MAG: transcription-repair coupling factor [Gammaproteobacteria bacterium]|nr:transcription-repair coupling factor [Gammaproteobacteria bacterium]
MKNPKEISVFRPPSPGDANKRQRWNRLFGSSRALALLSLAQSNTSTIIVVLSDARSLQLLVDELTFFNDAQNPVPVYTLPDWECLPYDSFSPHQDIVSQRLLTLSRLPGLRRCIVLTTISTIMHRLAPVNYVSGHSLNLAKGERINLTALRDKLTQTSYRSVSQVMEPGEYAVRGGLVDIFPMGSHTPYRIDLFGDEIESIRTFDPQSQLSSDTLDNIELLPAREFPVTEEAITRFRQAFRAQFEGDPTQAGVYRDISEGIIPSGAEYYIPLFFEQTATIFDYLPDKTVAVIDSELAAASGRFQSEITERYLQRRHDRERPILPPEKLFLEQDVVIARLKAMPIIELGGHETAGVLHEAPVYTFESSLPVQLPVDHHSESPYRELFDYLGNTRQRNLIVAETPGRRETMRELLAANGLKTRIVSGWHEFFNGDTRLALAHSTLDRGLLLQDPAIAVITEAQLFGERAAQRRRRSQTAREPEAIIRSLAELHIGDPIVHEQHGVGRYLGLEMLDVGDGPTEFLAIQYAGNDKLYLPVTSLHLIGRYTSTHPETAPLHRMGGDVWENAKKRAQKKARDVAAELLDIYARREARPGMEFKLNEAGYNAFADGFPFEETPDQARAINEVIADMQRPVPMDRLVCGDVGFGKTEVALRAAFVAVDNSKQVVVLVPTTLLAQQHFQNFQDRFAEWPVHVELLSRFRTKKEQEEVLDQARKGKVDIIVGTHRLLQDDIVLDRPGLIIVDEEQRFGVRQKEKLKKLRSEVDILTLTATPIPRTLNLGMTGLRDISIIATPPEQRLSVKTFVNENSNSIIREACLREIHRGGQVYYLHNEVRTMDKALADLQQLLPEARIHMAHGQMPERELERIMLDFYHQRFNILLCSTIIESGIDVPSANTILIERADKFGLAQLHQLRGRVGRSHHRAYAYMLIPSKQALTGDARKRLEAIASLDELGAGFALASHDLEIRGAGELLGESQSGEIDEIGFTMYTELLSRAVKSLKEGKEPELDKPVQPASEINIHAPVLFPAEYIPDVHTRLVLYKRLANAADKSSLQQLKEEVIDRFGLLPEETALLFSVSELRIDASRIGISKIDAGSKGARIQFETNPDIDPAALIQLMQSSPREYRLDGPTMLRVNAEMKKPADRLDRLARILNALVRA